MSQTSAFEILGPVMVGPSSSHTAGALRCAQVARSLVEGTICNVRFLLYNSFSHTYHGHGTDRALLGGIMGFATDDERIKEAFNIATERGITYEFVEMGDDPTIHPNTVDIQIQDTNGNSMAVRGESLGGGSVRISRINGVDVDISGAYDTLFVAHKDTPGVLANLTVLLSQEQINIAFMRTYRTERGGNAYTVFEMDEMPSSDILTKLHNSDNVVTATFIRVPGAGASTPGVTLEDLFESGKELLESCKRSGKSIGKVMYDREVALDSFEHANKNIARVLEVMREETTRPIEKPERSLGGLIGGEAQMMARKAKLYGPTLMGEVQTNAIARAMAVLERSATMGVIVAAPTAGSAGVVPGCVLAAAEALELSDEQTCEALFTAAAIGFILASNASVAGAEGGCQAEVGSASAMAAAALVEMLGGTPEQALNAASIAIGNLLGLVCDPVSGLVEVPCQNRNAIGCANAFSAAQLSLSGVVSLVPFDESAQVMLEVGRALPSTLRETAQGGLATAPSACAACGRCTK